MAVDKQRAPQPENYKHGDGYLLSPPSHIFSHTTSRTQTSQAQLLSSPDIFYLQPLYILSFPSLTHLTMSSTFKEFNGNQLQCSAWVKDKGRCCQRTIANADQKRRAALLQSVSAHQVNFRQEAEELADLYFCNGWHRPGGKYAIPTSERRKLLLLLFPEQTTRFESPPRSLQRPIPASTYASQDLESPDLTPDMSEAERWYSSVAQSAIQNPRNNVGSQRVPPISASTTEMRARPADSTSRENPQRRTQAGNPPSAEARSQNQGQRYTASSRTLFEDPAPEAFIFTTDNVSPPVATRQTSQNARSRRREPEILPQVAIPTPRRSARIRGEEPSSTPQVAVPTPRRSARVRGEEPSNTPQVAIPAASNDQRTPSMSTSQHPHPDRRTRLVNPDDDCPVCTLPLGDHGNVSRCNVCQNDLHRDCLLEWLTFPGHRQSCIHW